MTVESSPTILHTCPQLTAQKIDVNGELKSKKVTSNLEAALKQLRHEWSPRTLWVDALCINQDSSYEPATQIPKMGQIYSWAKEVYIWLGPEADNSDIAMKFIEKVSDVSQIDQLVKDPRYKPEWAAFAKLIRRKWFNRRWVVQELHFGSRKGAIVHCGQESVRWGIFALAVALFEANSLPVQSMFGSDGFAFGELQGLGATTLVATTNRMFASEQNKRLGDNVASLEELLFTLSMFQVSHPWDTVYAFLSLADNGNEIKVDYDKPLVHVLTEAVWKAIDSSKSVDIICRPWAPTCEEIEAWNAKAIETQQNQTQQAQTQLPSWIRNTTFSEFAPRNKTTGVQYDRINASLFVGQPGRPIYNASNSSTFTTMSDQYNLNKSIDTAPWILRLRGVLVDEIRSDGGAICVSSIHGSIPAAWVRLAKWDPRGTEGVPTEFWHTLVASRGLDGSEPPNWYGKACEHAWKETASWDLNTERVLNHCGSSMTANFIRKVRQTVWNRQMFRTHHLKLLGLGPSNAQGEQAVQHGDMIFIIKGCSVPVILRKFGEERYTFIGESYVHGLMGGNGRNMAKLGPAGWTPLQIV
jgi:hypothetical protein